jgi:DNA-directed RNA polymerase subunit RPC12/RpoP
MNPAFRFARGGKVYKEIEADQAHEIASYIRTGIIAPNDDYWMPGMSDWKKVSSRQWNFAAPSSSEPPTAAPNTYKPPAPTPTPTFTPAPTFNQGGGVFSYECPTCKKGFNNPAKAVSGYSVIRKAALFFILGMVLMGISLPIYLNWTRPAFFGDSRANFVIATIVYMLVLLSGFGLLLMSLFELIASAVTHGIYRAHPERCPHCKSHTFIKKA